MKQFLELVKREIKNNRRIDTNLSTFFKILKIFLKIIVLFVVIIFESVIFRMVIKVFNANMLQKEFLILFLTLFFVIQLIVGLIGLIKTLHKSNENIEILTLPIKPEIVFFSKLLMITIKQLCFAFLVCVPVLVNFSIITEQSFTFLLSIIPCILFSTIISIGLAVVLSIPLLKVLNAITNKFILVMLIYFVLIFVGFSLYIELLKNLLMFMQTENYAGLISLDFIYFIQDVSVNLYLFVLFKNILLGIKFIPSLTILLVLSIGVVALIKLFAKKYYFKTVRNSLIKEPKFSERKTKFKQTTPQKALLVKEAKTIFRSSNYAFSFFVISFSTPILVFSCNALISELGIKIAGSTIYPALAILILSTFMVMAGSFSATTITREGKNFSATKTFPIMYKEQINAKLSLYLLVEIPTLVISLLCLLLSGFIQILDMVMIFLIVGCLTYASITGGINLDIKKPQFNYLNNNEVSQNNSNISKNIAIGIAISIILSVASIVLLFVTGKNLLYIIILTISFAYAISNHYKLFIPLDKNYNHIQY